MEKGTTVVFVRHGQTVWNIQGRYQGQKNSPLTEIGEEGAAKLGLRISADPSLRSISAVYTSDLQRCIHTAEIIMLNSNLADNGVPLFRDSMLREMSFGSLEGAEWSNIKGDDKHFFDNWKADSYPPGGGESRLDVGDRMAKRIREICRGHPGEVILVISHGASLNAW